MILVSRCIMGEACRYNGKDAIDENAVWQLATEKILKVCPECMAGLPTPRMPMEIKWVDGQQGVYSKDGEDFTEVFHKGALLTLDLCKKNKISYAILKDKSPSCGSRYIYDGSFGGQLTSGMGITAKLLVEHGIRVYSPEEAPYEEIKALDD